MVMASDIRDNGQPKQGDPPPPTASSSSTTNQPQAPPSSPPHSQHSADSRHSSLVGSIVGPPSGFRDSDASATVAGDLEADPGSQQQQQPLHLHHEHVHEPHHSQGVSRGGSLGRQQHRNGNNGHPQQPHSQEHSGAEHISIIAQDNESLRSGGGRQGGSRQGGNGESNGGGGGGGSLPRPGSAPGLGSHRINVDNNDNDNNNGHNISNNNQLNNNHANNNNATRSKCFCWCCCCNCSSLKSYNICRTRSTGGGGRDSRRSRSNNAKNQRQATSGGGGGGGGEGIELGPLEHNSSHDRERGSGPGQSDLATGTAELFTRDLAGHTPPTHDDIRAWSESFDKLMKCPYGRKIFYDFLKCEYSEENILFWRACEHLKCDTPDAEVEEKVRLIYEDYISILSPKEVSLDSRVRDVINKNMVTPCRETFEEAQVQIYTLMHRDSYPRFVNSAAYRKLAGLPTPSRKGSAA